MLRGCGIEDCLKIGMDRNSEGRPGLVLANLDRAIAHVLTAHVNDVAAPLTRT